MSELNDLYQELILDHNRHPKNFGPLATTTHKAEGFNPLCGDRVVVHLEMEGDSIKNVSFEGSGCAISKASASIMTTLIKDKTKLEAQAIFDQLHNLVTSDPAVAVDLTSLGKLAAFAGVRQYPARVKCATLAWHTLRAALDGKAEPVSTEEEKKNVVSQQLSENTLKEEVIKVLKTCFDPEIPVNIYDLGLIYDIKVSDLGVVEIEMTLTTPNCPAVGSLPVEIEQKVMEIPKVMSVKVNLVFYPPWDRSMISEAAKLQLGIS